MKLEIDAARHLAEQSWLSCGGACHAHCNRQGIR